MCFFSGSVGLCTGLKKPAQHLRHHEEAAGQLAGQARLVTSNLVTPLVFPLMCS